MLGIYVRAENDDTTRRARPRRRHERQNDGKVVVGGPRVGA
ncbi:hypothetical protein QVL82_10155 [Cellulosimicrobium funkei]